MENVTALPLEFVVQLVDPQGNVRRVLRSYSETLFNLLLTTFKSLSFKLHGTLKMSLVIVLVMYKQVFVLSIINTLDSLKKKKLPPLLKEVVMVRKRIT